MTQLNEEKLEKYYELLDQIPSSTSTTEAPQIAFEKMRQRKFKLRSMKKSLLVAAIFCIVAFTSIRFSPTIAQAVAKIPGMQPFVEMIAYDNGMKDILAEGYYEEINKSQIINGTTLTITGVIADESGMSIAYKVDSEEDLAYVTGANVDVKHGSQEIDASVGSSWTHHKKGTFEVEDKIDIFSNEGMDYSIQDFVVNFSLKEEPSAIFTIPFTLTKEVKHSKGYTINKEVIIDDQKIFVNEILISPLRIQLKMSVDPNNSMKILNFEDIRILDEKNNVLGKIVNGVSRFGSIEDEQFSVMLESNYFTEPKKLKIEFNEIEAIDKKDVYVEIDWEKKKVLNQPNRIELNDLKINDNNQIEYSVPKYKKNEHKAIFNSMIDANDTVYYSNEVWISEKQDEQQIIQTFNIEVPPVNPVKLEVARYENYLKDVGTIEVKLD